MKAAVKKWFFSLLGKDPEAVVVVVRSGSDARAGAMQQSITELVPDRERIVFYPLEGESAGEAWLRLRRGVSGKRVALAAVLFDGSQEGAVLRRAALLAFPRRVLAFNASLERHHLRLSGIISALLFLRGVPLDRIHLRPSWLAPWKRDRSKLPVSWRKLDGRPWSGSKSRVAILSPYFPWPLSHGGAVRIYNLMREAAAEFDLVLFAFEDGQQEADFERLKDICCEIHIAAKPRYREPRWSTLLPPEACEFHTPQLRRAMREVLRALRIRLLQVEYTMMARYGGDVLVEHDVTWDLCQQVYERERTLSSWWDLFRWRKFEQRALRRHSCAVAMSAKDAAFLEGARVTVIPNGVDLDRFQPVAEPPGRNLLFVGSFRHFPNRQAYEFFAGELWPLLASDSEVRTVVVAGSDPQLYCPDGPPDARIKLLGFVSDVRPLYEQTNLVLVPTIVSAGTNLKALEAMAMERPMVSSPSGVAGLGLVHAESVWIAETPAQFAAGIQTLLDDHELRRRIAVNARKIAVERFGWKALARVQSELWNSLLRHDA
jgi:glycosyltransferase involved in cell wall biosynthesis